jgi:hypothetical protein
LREREKEEEEEGGGGEEGGRQEGKKELLGLELRASGLLGRHSMP